MSGTVLAHVRRIATSPEGRALVHAVSDNGFDFKIEVPLEAVRGVGEAGEHVLLFAWSLHTLPPVLQPPASAKGEPRPSDPTTAAPAPTTPVASSARFSLSAVDQQFMALMSRGASAPPPSSATPTTSPGTDPAARPGEQLAALLGIGRAPS